MQPDGPALLLLIATAVHLGFQLVVTALVYPAFAEVPDRQWAVHHDRHSSRIGPLVVGVYGLLVVACGWALVTGPGPWEVAAVAACAAAGAVTAGVAAPAHGRLGILGRDRDLAPAAGG